MRKNKRKTTSSYDSSVAPDAGYTLEDFNCNQKYFGMRVRIARVSLGWSQKHLAKMIGVTETTIQEYEKGSLPKGNIFVLLVTALNCSADWLLFGRECQKRPESEQYPVYIQDNTDGLVMISKVKGKLNAGTGSLVTGSEEYGKYAFRHDWIRLRGNPSQMVLMDVFGESMEPQIQDGDTVLIDQSQTEVITGRIYAVGIDEEVMVKYIEWKPGRMVLRSANERWDDIEVDMRGDQAELVRIIGRVIWWCREAR